LFTSGEPKSCQTFRDGVSATLRYVLGGENHFLRWSYTPYFYSIGWYTKYVSHISTRHGIYQHGRHKPQLNIFNIELVPTEYNICFCDEKIKFWCKIICQYAVIIIIHVCHKNFISDFECILDESNKPVNVKKLPPGGVKDTWQR